MCCLKCQSHWIKLPEKTVKWIWLCEQMWHLEIWTYIILAAYVSTLISTCTYTCVVGVFLQETGGMGQLLLDWQSPGELSVGPIGRKRGGMAYDSHSRGNRAFIWKRSSLERERERETSIELSCSLPPHTYTHTILTSPLHSHPNTQHFNNTLPM